MNLTERLEDLKRLVAELAGCEASEVGLDDDLRASLGLDSLTALRLLALVEKRHGVRFPDERLSKLRTLREVLDAMEETER